MGTPTQEHLERIEHAHHTAGHAEGGHHEEGHGGNSLDKKVAMTMAIVAALLAAVTLMSHRAHNETLRLEGEANRHQTEANILHTQASDAWNYYQAKNNRFYQAEGFLTLLETSAVAPANEGAAPKAEKSREDWNKKLEKYKEELPELKKKAEELVEAGHKEQEQAKEIVEQGHAWHSRGDRFDVAELAVELALVLCSVTVLTKRTTYWYAGIGFAGVGLLVGLSALLISGH